MKKYCYVGPVVIFGKCVANNWTGETMAVSSGKAMSNLKFQYKKEHNMSSGTKVELTGKLREV